ncbi:hypothetical protein EMIT0P253_380046 [Pseudomonas sp. IT-P253]
MEGIFAGEHSHRLGVMQVVGLLPTGRKWQGRLDSNQRMAGSKPAALPLGDAPVTCAEIYQLSRRTGSPTQNIFCFKTATYH